MMRQQQRVFRGDCEGSGEELLSHEKSIRWEIKAHYLEKDFLSTDSHYHILAGELRRQ